MRLLILLFISVFPFFSGKPAKDAIVILENINNKSQVGYQKVGEKGKVAFYYLNDGRYQLSIIFPQQEGKWIKEKRRHRTFSKATYNEKKRTYYYQSIEGYFSIKLIKVRKIDADSFRTVFREKRGEVEKQIVIADFTARKNGAQISLQIKKLTAAQYKRATDKAGGDISTISIPGGR